MDAPAGGSCSNCGTPLTGRFCASCGQRALAGLPSVPHLLEEAGEMLTHADSRLWATLLPLLLRPGRLTAEFIAGHRARYLPPLRLYLVLSVLFFLVMGIGARDEAPKAAPAGAAATQEGAHRKGPRQEDCAGLVTDVPGKEWIEPRLRSACLNIARDGGTEFGHAVAHNMGRAMFVFLPLLAGLLSLMYWRPRVPYVAHLLLLLHNHAAVFLLLSATHLAGMVLPGDWDSLPNALAVAWLTVYCYRSMRVVYGQGRGRTLAKFLVLGMAYVFVGAFTFLAAAILSAITL